jgi:hypothetical protein
MAAGRPPPDVTADNTVMRRLLGLEVKDQPLLPQAGDIWADVLPAAQPERGGTTSVSSTHTAGFVAPAASRTVEPRAVTQLIVAAAPVPAVPSAGPDVRVVPGSGGLPLVQLAAAPSRQGAEAEWRRLRQQARMLTDGHRPAINEAEVNGQHVWRLRAAGFTDVAEATAFCSGMRAVTAGCWVVTASASR